MGKKTIATQMKILGFCIKFSFEASRTFTILRFVLEMAISSLPLISMFCSKIIVNNLAYNAKDSIRQTIALILFTSMLLILNSGLGTVRGYFAQCHNDKLDLIISKKKFEKSVSIDLAYFDSSKYYNELVNATTNASSISATVWNFYSMLGVFIKTVSLFVIFTRYSILLAILLVLFSIPCAVIENRHKNKLLSFQKQLTPLNRRLGYTSSIFTDRTCATEMRVNRMEEYMYEQFEKDWELRFNESKNITAKHGKRSFLVSNMPQLVIIVTTVFLAVKVCGSDMLIGDYTYITGTAQQLLSSVILLIGSYARYQDGINRAKDFVDFLDMESQVIDEGTLTLDPNIVHKVSFTNVSFKYPGTDRIILRDVNFSFSTKDRIALVGQNGSGKTTIVKLLLRLYDVDSGSITIDGIDIKKYKLTEVRKFYGLMQQNFNKYSFTLKDNIALSSPDFKDDTQRILMAIKNADAEGVLEKVGGLDTYLTRIYDEKGVELSGGEWQKIALARCFFKNAPFLVLDEPSASIDAKSEHELFENISKTLCNRGLLLISHRLSNIKNSDHIFVLDEASIVENGTHDELMENKKLYFEMYSLQLEKYL